MGTTERRRKQLECSVGTTTRFALCNRKTTTL